MNPATFHCPPDERAEPRRHARVFRTVMSPGERRRGVVGGLVVLLALNAGALIISRSPGVSVAARADWAAMLHVISWLPGMLVLLCWLIPQKVMRVSPRGIWYAQTRCGRIPGTSRRWAARWNDIDRLRWGARRCDLRLGRKRRSLQLTHWQGAGAADVRNLIATQLADRFDLSNGTLEERRLRHRASWTWGRHLLDKAELICCALGMLAVPLLPMSVVCGRFDVALGALPFVEMFIANLLYERRLGWQEPKGSCVWSEVKRGDSLAPI